MGTFEEQLQECLRGLAEAVPHLRELGANDDQIKEFENVLRRAVGEILASDIGQTRHWERNVATAQCSRQRYDFVSRIQLSEEP